MSAADIANRHLTAALSDAKAEGVDTDALCRSLLGLIVELPRQGLRLVSGLGDLVLGVRTDTGGMIGRGRLSVLGRSGARR